jgi:hypothetical protein
VEQAEDQRRGLGVGLDPEPFLVGPEVVERLVDHRQADDRVDDVGVDAPAIPDAQQHRHRMADGEDADVDGDVLHLVEEEHDAEQEQDVVVARHHVLGAEIDEGDDVHPPDFLDIARVTRGDVMGQRLRHARGVERKHREEEREPSGRAWARTAPSLVICESWMETPQ